jgi:hypothetical protein
MNKAITMREWVYNCWNVVMDHHNKNPLSAIPDFSTRHMIMQVLAWMWCIVFSSYFGSMWMFGITAIAHVIVLAAIAVTVVAFETAKRNPQSFNYKFHTPSRARQIMYLSGNGKMEMIELDPNDPGGEHE